MVKRKRRKEKPTMYTGNAKKKLSDEDVEIAVAQNRIVVIDLVSKTTLSLTHTSNKDMDTLHKIKHGK